MSDAQTFRELASKCRNLAAKIDDKQTIDARDLAEEYDRQAAEAADADQSSSEP